MKQYFIAPDVHWMNVNPNSISLEDKWNKVLFPHYIDHCTLMSHNFIWKTLSQNMIPLLKLLPWYVYLQDLPLSGPISPSCVSSHFS